MKKKYKWGFSFFNLLDESQKEIVKIQTMFKGILGIALASTYITTASPGGTLIVAIAGAFADAIIACFWFEEIKQNDER